MRNIFEQYESPGNRLTHALACCLNEDRTLFRGFVAWVTGRMKDETGKLVEKAKRAIEAGQSELEFGHLGTAGELLPL